MLRRGIVLVALVASLAVSQFAWAGADWAQFKARFMMADGRIVDTGNNNVSHTEGQGYAMLFALADNDRAGFDKIWQWTRANLKNADNGLFYWRFNPVDPDPVADKNNASDGDTLIAWALLKAGEQWQERRYIEASDQITRALLKHTVISFAGRQVMLPGAKGFHMNSYVNINPSYFVFPAWRDFARHSHLAAWRQLIDDGYALLSKMGWGDANLPADWVSLRTDGSMKPAPQWPARSSYDAIRIPLYVAWDSPDGASLAPWRNWWRKFSRSQTPAWVNVNTNETAPYNMQGGLLAVRDFTQGELSEAATRVEPSDDYYSATLKLLCALAASAH